MAKNINAENALNYMIMGFNNDSEELQNATVNFFMQTEWSGRLKALFESHDWMEFRRYAPDLHKRIVQTIYKRVFM